MADTQDQQASNSTGFSPFELYKNLLTRLPAAVQAAVSVDGGRRSIVVNKVWVDSSKNKEFDIDDLADAKRKGLSITNPIFANISLIDKSTGKILDNKEKIRVGNVPHLTPHGTFLLQGSEYFVRNQSRLRSGVYTKARQNGELSSYFNLKKGRNFELDFDPESGSVNLKVGHSSTPLLPVLYAIGAKDDEIAKEWGADFLLQNKKSLKNIDADARKASLMLTGKRPENDERAVQSIKEFFFNSELDSENNKSLLGTDAKNVDHNVLLKASNKLMRVYKGQEGPDDMDNLLNKTVHSMDDLFIDRLGHWKNKRDLNNKIKSRIDRFDTIENIVHSTDLTGIMSKFFLSSTDGGSGLIQLADQNNPVQMFSDLRKITMMGEGGISSERSIPLTARRMHPSSFGVLDPIFIQESSKIGAEHHVSDGAVKIGNKLGSNLIDIKTKQRVKVVISDMHNKTTAMPDQFSYKDGNLVPKGSLVRAVRMGKVVMVPPSEVDYLVPSSSMMFSTTARLSPMLGAVSGARGMLGTKMMEQAIPLKFAETPLVRSISEDGKSLSEIPSLGRALQSKIDGVVDSFDGDRMFIKDASGKLFKHGMYNNYPTQSGVLLHHTPIVKIGDQVKQGQVLADSNFSKGGTLALGVNLRTAFLNAKGHTYEDGIVISESAAKKMTSSHLSIKEFSLGEDSSIGKNKFRAAFPGLLSDDHSNRLDDDGIIQMDQEVHPNELLITGLTRREPKPEDAILRKIGRKLARPLVDSSVSWDGDTVGKVVRVEKLKDKIRVYIRHDQEMRVGDKMSGMGYGNKCYDPETEVLTNFGWKKFYDISDSDLICTINPDTHVIEYQEPMRKISYWFEGKMYRIARQRLDLMTTPDHKHWVRTQKINKYSLRSSSEIFGKNVLHKKTGIWMAPDIETITIPGIESRVYKGRHKYLEPITFGMDDFIEFFGYWVTEGSAKNGGYVCISQYKNVNPDIYEKIDQVLKRLGIPYSKDAKRFSIFDHRLSAWLSRLGKAHEKWIPQEIMSASSRQLNILLEACIDGDGCVWIGPKNTSENVELSTSSKRLADSYQELALKAGFCASVKLGKKSGEGWCKHNSYKVRLSRNGETYSSPKEARYGAREAWVDYIGMVYCVEVKNHVIYVRRNGVPVWSGNSIVTKIIPDHEMPQTKSGEATEVLFNPFGVPGRVNPAQILEAASAKIAHKTGKPYYVKSFQDGDYVSMIKKDLEKNELTDKEDLIDPKTGKVIPQVMTGINHWLKLKHQVSTKYSARDVAGYDIDGQPTRGGEEGAKRLDPLQNYALLSHGANQILADVALNKSDKNDEMWRSIKMGLPMPPPRLTFATEKFLGMLRAAGINPKQNGKLIRLMPMTDKDTLDMSKGQIKNALALRAEDLSEEKFGLFDPDITGGKSGSNWSHMSLAEPMPSPVMQGAIQSIAGITESQFYDLLSGKAGVDKSNKVVASSANSVSGGAAIKQLLDAIDPKKEFDSVREQLQKETNITSINKLNKKGRVLRGLVQSGMKPGEAYMVNHIPILPPKMRPAYPLPSGALEVSSLNNLYRDLFLSNQYLGSFSHLGAEQTSDLRVDVYDALKAIQGLGDPISNRQYKGVLSTIAGSPPKTSYFQRKLLGRPMDSVSRSTIIPDPDLHPDEVGIPEDMAWKIFNPFIIRELGKSGVAPLSASNEIEKRTERAKKALEIVMNDRPVILNRAPSLHKFSVLSFKPHIVEGEALQLPPLVFKGFNADTDGDTMMASVPISNEARDESRKLFPSEHLTNPGTGDLMILPKSESIYGLYLMSKEGKKTGHKFKSIDEALSAHEQGKFEDTDVVNVDGIGQTTAGRIKVNAAIPEKYRDYSKQFDNRAIKKILSEIVKDDPKGYGDIVFKIKALGDDASYFHGTTIGLDDLVAPKKIRDSVFLQAQQKLDLNRTPENAFKLFSEANTKVEEMLDEHYSKNPSHIWSMIKSGALGKKAQAMQMVVAPVLVNDEGGKTIPYPITKSFSEGLNISDYFSTLYGQRAGMIDRALSTAEPGEIQKETIVANLKQQISEDDCGAEGIQISVDDRSIYNRFLGADINIDGQIIAKRGDTITSSIVTAAKKHGLKELNARSPLNDQSETGICKVCAGMNERGQKYETGFNLGALSAMTLSEPLTQGVLRNFHQGGTSFSKTVSGLGRIRQLIELPQIIANSGSLSMADGIVQKIEELPSGDHKVTVNGVPHFVQHGLDILVGEGQKVKKGARLSGGVYKPQEILETEGLDSARNYIVDELSKTYKEGNNIDMDRRFFEVIAKSVSDHAYIDDPGDEEMRIRGDYMPLTKAAKINKDLVANGKRPMMFKPILKGVVQTPLLSDDWMARLGARYLSKTLIEGAATGMVTNVGEGGQYVPKFAYGIHLVDKSPKIGKLNDITKATGIHELEFHGPLLPDRYYQKKDEGKTPPKPIEAAPALPPPAPEIKQVE